MDRLTTLPNRALLFDASTMEFAYQDAAYIYLITYAPAPSAPADLTKLQFDRSADVLSLAGERVTAFDRMTSHIIYDDPTPAIGTPADFDPAAAILAEVEGMVDGIAAWAARTLGARPLFEQLAPAATDATAK